MQKHNLLDQNLFLKNTSTIDMFWYQCQIKYFFFNLCERLGQFENKH